MSQTANLVEKMFQDVKNEDLTSIKQTLATDKNPSKWASIINYEAAIVTLMEGVLESDIILPRLVMCGVRVMSPLHYSALRGADSILANFLAHARIPVQTQLSGGATLLHFACFAGNLSTIKMLIDEWSVDMYQKDSYGWSPLHYASIGGQQLVAEELCKRGANVFERDQDGTTAAYRAYNFGHEGLVDFFKKLTNNDPKLLAVKLNDGGSVNVYDTVDASGKRGKKSSSEYKDIDFIIDNAYDFPDNNISRIYISSSEIKNNNTANADKNNNNEDKTITVAGSVYDLPDDVSNKKPTVTNADDLKKEEAKKKIQAMVESQFKDVFNENTSDPYLQPINNNNNAGMYDTLNNNNGMEAIGFRTLKYLLRSEFQKYKSTFIQPSTPLAPEQNKNDPIYDDIYEEIVKGSVKLKENQWVRGGQTMRSRFNQERPPLLPPRNSKIGEDLYKPIADLPQQQSVVATKEFTMASSKLNLIEETQVVKEACFNELLGVLAPGDWQKLAYALPIRENKLLAEEKVKRIEKQFPKEPRKQARAALQDWNFHFGKNATLDKLVEAMKKCGLVEKIKSVEMASKREFLA